MDIYKTLNEIISKLKELLDIDNYTVYMNNDSEYLCIITAKNKLTGYYLDQVSNSLLRYSHVITSVIEAYDGMTVIRLKRYAVDDTEDFSKRVFNFSIKLRSIMLNFDKELDRAFDHVDGLNHYKSSFVFKDVELNDFMRMGIKEIAKKYKLDLKLININNDLTVEVECAK